MNSVGIIANPSASKDIRRIVSQGRVVPDWEKVNIIRRALFGIASTGIRKVITMPDSAGLCLRASDDPNLSLTVETLDMPAYYVEGDTTRAAELMQKSNIGSLVTLGGDGTNRAVAKGSSAIPIVPISTGTNNVFPSLTEGTLAGIAAGLVAQNIIDLPLVSTVSKVLKIDVDDNFKDIALIDVALSKERFLASRAIWDLSTLYDVFLTRAEPSSIGLSSIGARLQPISQQDNHGIRYSLSNDDTEPKCNTIRVMAPIAPGMVSQVNILNWQTIGLGIRAILPKKPYTVALDGERSFTVTSDEELSITLERNGPPVIDVDEILQAAAKIGAFTL
tara:strand:+ start:9892 stop:10893 length:1002 start_codon:yes stop_codon:yes gene_type:complete